MTKRTEIGRGKEHQVFFNEANTQGRKYVHKIPLSEEVIQRNKDTIHRSLAFHTGVFGDFIPRTRIVRRNEAGYSITQEMILGDTLSDLTPSDLPRSSLLELERFIELYGDLYIDDSIELDILGSQEDAKVSEFEIASKTYEERIESKRHLPKAIRQIYFLLYLLDYFSARFRFSGDLFSSTNLMVRKADGKVLLVDNIGFIHKYSHYNARQIVLERWFRKILIRHYKQQVQKLLSGK